MAKVVGVDEVGRSALAGPLVICFYSPARIVEGVADSKQLGPAKCQQLAPELIEAAAYCRIISVSPDTIDLVGIVDAEMFAIAALATEVLSEDPDYRIIVDGPRYKVFDRHWQDMAGEAPWKDNIEFRINADETVYAVAAASIVAKAWRDELMHALAEEYPEYGWETNVGYGTPAHRKAIEEYGLTPFHRKTFCRAISTPKG